MFLTCNPVFNENCNHTKQETFDYLGNTDLIYLVNQQRFDLNNFEIPIIKESVILNQNFDQTKASFTSAKIRLEKVDEEIDYL